jgi:SRSO17 transposase
MKKLHKRCMMKTKSCGRLEMADLLEPLGRSERKHWSEVYVRGLLFYGERKSIPPLASRVPDGNVQAMQQLVGQSPWAWLPIWELLGKRMTAELEPDSVWVIDDTGFPKQGKHSVGVERQYSGTLGKVGNCQVAVSVHHVGEQGHTILGWRLYLPESWAKDRQRREEAGIPPEVNFQTKWQLGLDIIDQVRGWGLADRIVLSDAAYGDVTEFRDGLESRDLRYIVGISSSLGVWTRPPTATVPPRHSGRGAPAARHDYGKQRPMSVLEAARKAKGWKVVRWRQGTKGWLESRFVAMRVQPSHGFVRGKPPHQELWLLVEWPESEKEPIKYFFCDLPETYTLRRWCAWRSSLEDRAGLSAIEARTWTGSLRRTQLDRLAPPHHARHDGTRIPSPRNSTAKKNFWLDPAHRRAVRFNICLSPGAASASNAGAKSSPLVHSGSLTRRQSLAGW